MNRRLREALTLGVIGAALGLVVAVLVHSRASKQVIPPDVLLELLRPRPQVDASKAGQSSTFVAIQLDEVAPDWTPMLFQYVGIGLVAGLIVFAVLLVARRRLTLERTS